MPIDLSLPVSGKILLATILVFLNSCSDEKGGGKAFENRLSPSDATNAEGEDVFLKTCLADREQTGPSTVKAVLEKMGDKDCERVALKLSSLDSLNLSDLKIKDLEPIAGLVGLNTLFLDHNKISDLGPLAAMVDLKVLSVTGNLVKNLSPLTGLNNLERLYLGQNPLEDLAPLGSLAGLKAAWVGTGPEARTIRPASALTAQMTESSGKGICKAGYFYHPFESCRHSSHPVESYKRERSQACGVEKTTPVYKSCRTPANGPEETSVGNHVHEFKSLAPREDKPKNEQIQKKVESDCLNWGNSFGTADIYPKVSTNVSVRQGLLLSKAFAFYTSNCQVSLHHYRDGRHSQCGVEYLEPTFNLCEHPSHGVEAYQNQPSAACGTKTEMVASEGGLKREEITRLGEVLSCRSCDDQMTFAKPDMEARAACLMKASQSDPSSYINEELVKFKEDEIGQVSEEQAVAIEKL